LYHLTYICLEKENLGERLEYVLAISLREGRGYVNPIHKRFKKKIQNLVIVLHLLEAIGYTFNECIFSEINHTIASWSKFSPFEIQNPYERLFDYNLCVLWPSSPSFLNDAGDGKTSRDISEVVMAGRLDGSRLH